MPVLYLVLVVLISDQQRELLRYMEFSDDADGISTLSMSDDATEAFLAGIGSRYILKMVEAQKVADESKHVDLLFRIQDLFIKLSRGIYSISPEQTGASSTIDAMVCCTRRRKTLFSDVG